MQIYSEVPAARARQVVGDVVAVAVVVLAVVAGVAVAGAISALAEVGRTVERAGAGLQGTLADAAEALDGLPLVGGAASAPFTSASGAGATLVDAGRQQQELVGQLALVAGLAVALVPVLVVLRSWGARRLAFVRRARDVRRLAAGPGGDDLLALRALAGQEARVLRSVADDPVGGWRRGDPATVRALADLALRDAGLRPRR